MPNIFEKIYFKYKTRTLKDFIFYKFRINNLFRFLKKIMFGKDGIKNKSFFSIYLI